MAIIPTVRIKHPGFPDGVLINEPDFDPKTHELFKAPAAPAKSDDDAADEKAGGGKAKK